MLAPPNFITFIRRPFSFTYYIIIEFQLPKQEV
jgi:hypothetical protein